MDHEPEADFTMDVAKRCLLRLSSFRPADPFAMQDMKAEDYY